MHQFETRIPIVCALSLRQTRILRHQCPISIEAAHRNRLPDAKNVRAFCQVAAGVEHVIAQFHAVAGVRVQITLKPIVDQNLIILHVRREARRTQGCHH